MALGEPKLRRTRPLAARTCSDRHAVAAGQRPAPARSTAGVVGRTGDAGGGNAGSIGMQ